MVRLQPVSDKELNGAGAHPRAWPFWEPKSIRRYRTDMEIIEQKAQNREIAAKAPAPRLQPCCDLVKVLQYSLNRTQSLKAKRTSGTVAAYPRARSSSNDAEQAPWVSGQTGSGSITGVAL